VTGQTKSPRIAKLPAQNSEEKQLVSDTLLKYDEWHSDKPIDDYPDAPWHRLVRKYLKNEDFENKAVLEIGCGRGDFACSLTQTFPKPSLYLAADYSPVAVARGKAFAAGKNLTLIQWAVNDIQALPYPDNTFETIISCETIEHVPDPVQGVRELHRVLGPGGRLFLSTPNYLKTIGLYRGYMRLTGRRYTETGQPINNFVVLPQTRAWLTSVGLKILATDATGHYLPIPGRPPVEVPVFNDPRPLMRWFGHHSFILAKKPSASYSR
jgi:ubiquinone/menaquinone biosynthesis C-methylase UbiE